MGNHVFLFDLDATVTKVEILPTVAQQIGFYDEMCELTEKTMRGELPFKNSFLARVEMLKDIPVSRVSDIVEKIPLNEHIVDFIRHNNENCYIVTGNLDVWIDKVVAKIGIPMSHCLCSSASVHDDKLLSVNSVMDKGMAVKQFLVPVVAIGDGSNDAEMIRLADVGVGFGGVRPVAYSLLSNATHVIYDEDRLCRFLHTLNGEQDVTAKSNTSVVISCAGMGTRLGLGCTKALVEIEGKPLLERQLEILKDFDDIRVVVGYQAEKVIEMVTSVRKDVMFVFNHDYRNTGTGASFTLGAKYGREYVVALDGDLLVHPKDLIAGINYEGSCVGGTTPSTDNPWLMPTKKIRGIENVTGFNQEYGDYEWTGFAKLRSDALKPGKKHVFHLIEPMLPLPMIFIRTKEIDTVDDYERAVTWVRNGYEE